MKFLYLVFFVVLVFLGYFMVFDYFNVVPINNKTKTCLITGASSGIGKALAKAMVQKGWKVLGIARGEERLKKLQSELGESFSYYVCDVGDHEQVREVSHSIKQVGLQPTLFFLNAGAIGVEKKFEFSLKQHKDVFDVNYFGVVAWIEQWLNFVKDLGGGTFVAMSSVNAIFSGDGAAMYGATKSALNRCFQSLLVQYGDDNIGFSIVMPGAVDTDMLQSKENIPYVQSPDDVANYIVKSVFKGKAVIEPNWLDSLLFRFYAMLPYRWVETFYV